MSEEAPEEQEVEAGEPPTEEAPLGEGGKKALKAEREKRKAAEKAAADAAARVKEFEDRDKSELQRLTDAQQQAEKELGEARTEALRLRIAVKHGITDEDAGVFLTGGDEETLTRQAERLAELRSTTPPPSPRPTERLKTGTDPTKGEEVTLAEQVRAAEQAGKWAEARNLKSQQLMELAKNNH